MGTVGILADSRTQKFYRMPSRQIPLVAGPDDVGRKWSSSVLLRSINASRERCGNASAHAEGECSVVEPAPDDL